MFLAGNLFSSALRIFEAADDYAPGGVNGEIARVHAVVAGGIRFLDSADFDPRIAVDVRELFVLSSSLVVIDFVASLERCPREIVDRDELIKGRRTQHDLAEHAGAIMNWHSRVSSLAMRVIRTAGSP